jgi:hypothetical protein
MPTGEVTAVITTNHTHTVDRSSLRNFSIQQEGCSVLPVYRNALNQPRLERRKEKTKTKTNKQTKNNKEIDREMNKMGPATPLREVLDK